MSRAIESCKNRRRLVENLPLSRLKYWRCFLFEVLKQSDFPFTTHILKKAEFLGHFRVH